MFETYILPVLIFIGLGLAAGLLLSVASVLFHVPTDERVTKVRACLPGINCGACGYRGCDDYAAAIVEKGAKTNLCIPGGDTASKQISSVLGTEYQDVIEQVAYVRCNGTPEATSPKYIYTGVSSCAGATALYSGQGSCAYGCLGFGDCTKACIFDAIHVVNQVAVVDPDQCTGCQRCTIECPKGLIGMKRKDKPVIVVCSNRQTGKNTRSVCQNGCIACKKCERSCPHDAIHVTDNLASIDYEKCTSCGTCVEVCPVGCIKM